MRRPTTDFRNLDSAQLIQFGEEIVKKMEEHDAVFVTPTPSLTVMSAAIVDFRKAVANAAFNDRQAISARRESRAELEYLINELSKYVDTMARGNPTIILSAGFVPSKEVDYSMGLNPKALNLRVEPAGLGTMRVVAKIEPWKKARYYQFEFRKKGAETEWEKVLSTKAVLEISNLVAFEEYEFRVTYLGRDTNPNYSDVISTFAL
ncbi:hypothetical protein [Sphingobacterium faecale]|uniref:Fibronectin type III domain-containing protein n=1 Tax=Sphingobacterium faecale TaxID=2803775 RepID=A0ABS1R0Y8_9SPHI|nr:hypothetical protein [Sphingobacterium faecale]MBL1408135.1 hypothetical protein [Sphingobacterium faecale]